MSERDGFLRAIAADPADDTVRLAFADWLDEHGDPDRAEFIRVQIQLGNANRKSPRHAKLAARERKLLDAHQAEWLGPLPRPGGNEAFEPVFRRGFVESASIHGRVLAEHADAVRDHCPALVELDVVGVRGNGAGIAAAECLRSVRTLRLEDWPNPMDAIRIANSPHLARLGTLSFWLGSQYDEVVCRGLHAISKTMPALRRVELVQLRGGMTAGAAAAELAAHADRMAALVHSLRGAPVAAVDRPFDVLFPLAGSVGRHLFGGTLPDGRQVLARGGRECELFYFDADGGLTGGERIDLSGVLTREPEFPYREYNEAELLERLGERVGFRPGMVRVREFDAGTVFPNHWLSVYKFGGGAVELINNPDEPDAFDAEDWEGSLGQVRFFLRGSNFCITAADECWADERGVVHST